MLWFSVHTTIVLWFLGSDNSKYVVCAFRTPTSSSSITTTSNVQQIGQQLENINGLSFHKHGQTRSNSKTRRKGTTNGRRIVSTTALFFGSQPDNPLEILDEVDPGLHKKKKNVAKEEAIGLAYKRLGIEPHTYLDKVVLKNAYKRMATKYHPDVVINRDSTAEEKMEANDKFAIINAAYKTLRVLYVEKDDPQISGTYYSQKKGAHASTSTTTNNNSESTPAQKEEKEILIRDKYSRKGKHRSNGWWQDSFPRIYDTRDYLDHVPPIQVNPSVNGKTSDKEDATFTVEDDETHVTEIARETDSLVEDVKPLLDSIAHNGIDKKPSYPNNDDDNNVDESKFKDPNDKKIENSTSNPVPAVQNVWRDVIKPPTSRKVYTRIPGRVITTDKRKAKDDFANFNGASNVNFLGQGGQTMISPLSSSRWTTKYVSTRTPSKKRSIASSYYRRKNTGSSRTVKLHNKKEETTTNTRQKEDRISPPQNTDSGNSSEEAKLRNRHTNINAMANFEKISSSLSDALTGQGAHAASTTSSQRNAKTRQGSVPAQHRSKPFAEKKQHSHENAPKQRRSNSSIKKTDNPKTATGGIKNWWKEPTSQEMHQRIYIRTEQTHSEKASNSQSKLPRIALGEKSKPPNASEAQSMAQAISNDNEETIKQETLPVTTSLSTSTNEGASMEECQTSQSQTDSESFTNNHSEHPTAGAIPNWWDKYQPVQGYGDLPLTSTSNCNEDGTHKGKGGGDSNVAPDIVNSLPQEEDESETNTIAVETNTIGAELSNRVHPAASLLSLEVGAEATFEDEEYDDDKLFTKPNTQLKINGDIEQPLSSEVFNISPFIDINEDDMSEGKDEGQYKNDANIISDLDEIFIAEDGLINNGFQQEKEESETNTIIMETNTNDAELSNGVPPATTLSSLERIVEETFEHEEHDYDKLFTKQSTLLEINGDDAEQQLSSEEFSIPTFIDADEDNTPEGRDEGEYENDTNRISDLDGIFIADEDGPINNGFQQEKEESETNTIIMETNTNNAELSSGVPPATTLSSLETSAETTFEYEEHDDDKLFTKQSTLLEINGDDAEQQLSSEEFSIPTFIDADEDNTPEENYEVEYRNAVDIINDLNEILTTDEDYARAALTSPETNNRRVKDGPGFKVASGIINELHHVLTTDEDYPQAAILSPEAYIATFYKNAESTVEESMLSELSDSLVKQNSQNGDIPLTRGAVLSSPENNNRRVKAGPGFKFASDIINELHHVLTTDEDYPQAAILSPEAYIATFYKNAESNVEESMPSELSESFVTRNSEHEGLPLAKLDKIGNRRQEHTAKDGLEESEALIGHMKASIATSLKFDETSIAKESHPADALLSRDRSIGVLKELQLFQVGNINLVVNVFVGKEVDQAITWPLWIGDCVHQYAPFNRPSESQDCQGTKQYTAPTDRLQLPKSELQESINKDAKASQIEMPDRSLEEAAITSLTSRKTPIIVKRYTPPQSYGSKHPIALQESETSKPNASILGKHWWHAFTRSRTKYSPLIDSCES